MTNSIRSQIEAQHRATIALQLSEYLLEHFDLNGDQISDLCDVWSETFSQFPGNVPRPVVSVWVLSKLVEWSAE
jgi:hypothetical protein